MALVSCLDLFVLSVMVTAAIDIHTVGDLLSFSAFKAEDSDMRMSSS